MTYAFPNWSVSTWASPSGYQGYSYPALGSDLELTFFARLSDYIRNRTQGHLALGSVRRDERRNVFFITVTVPSDPGYSYWFSGGPGLELPYAAEDLYSLQPDSHSLQPVTALGERIIADVGRFMRPRKLSAPIVGWRAWFVSRDSPHRLHPVNFSGIPHAWPVDRPYQAVCLAYGLEKQVHSAPDPLCSCGIYACDSIVCLQRETHIEPLLPDQILVCGAVRCWGRGVRHEHGWRVGYARPLGLIRQGSPSASDVVEAVARRYGIGAWDSFSHAEAHVKEWSVAQ